MVIIAQDTKLKPGYKQTEVGVIPEDWEVRSVEEIADVTTGDKNTQDKTESGAYPFFVRSQIVERINSYFYDGEAVLTAGDGVRVGKVFHYTNGKFDFHQRVYMIYNFRQFDGFFFYLYFSNNFYKEATKYNAKSSVDSVRREMVTRMKIPHPSLPEQQAIATVLSDVDALITSLDQLIAKKRDIKQATMQQLLTGKIRLPGFSGEWEVKELEEIREKFVNGGTPSTQKSEYWQGNIPWITGADVINQKISDIRRFITTEAVKNSSTNIVEKGNLLLVTRTGVGKLAVASFDVAISQDITGIYVKKGQASIEYLFHCFNYSSETLKSLNQGTSIAGITRETLLSTRVDLPPLLEQTAIATVLSDMDAEIVALEQKRDKTRALKQGMMQELLTGKTRLL